MKNLLLVVLVVLATNSAFAQQSLLDLVSVKTNIFGSVTVMDMKNNKNFILDCAKINVVIQRDNKISGEFRYEAQTNTLQLAYATYKVDENSGITLGRFLDPLWFLLSAPHTMEMISYPSIMGFGVVEDGIRADFKNDLLTGKASIFSRNGETNMSASIDLKVISAFMSTNGNSLVLGMMANYKFSDLFSSRVGLVSIKDKTTGIFIENRTKIDESTGLWIQGNFEKNQRTSLLIGLVRTYSENSFIKLFYNIQENLVVGRVTFFL